MLTIRIPNPYTHIRRHLLKALNLIRLMLEVWKKELRVCSRSLEDTSKQITVKSVYLAILSMSTAVESLQSRRGPVGAVAKCVAQLVKQL